MKNSLIGCVRETGLFMKMVATATLITFGMLILSPTALAAHAELDKARQSNGSDTSETELAEVLHNLTEKLDKLEEHKAHSKDPSHLISEIKQLQDDMDDLDEEVMDNFKQLEAKLKKDKLPQKILERHQKMVQHYLASREALKKQLGDIDKNTLEKYLSDWVNELLVLFGQQEAMPESPYTHVDPKKFKRSQQPFNPNNLPNKSMRPDKNNKPKKRIEDFHNAGLYNTPSVKLAALGDFTFDKLAGANNPDYLAETDEVLLTQPIKDQAQALEYDPVKIYHWVRNNVEWQPTWGAVQDAELTLDARRGNAMDIASLTIALLRASLIPARYVHGTIEVPIQKFNNWAGGFTSSDAAVDYAASGGIPTSAALKGGKIFDVQLEHIWVEAAIDYFPSRGAKNRDADAWVQMDASYKQYQFLEGLDAVAISGIDTDQLAQDFLDSGTVNEAEGWASGFNPEIIRAAQLHAQNAQDIYINNNIPNPTVGDVIGGRQTIIQEAPALASGLPNNILIEGVRYDELPVQLQQRVTYSIGKDVLNQPDNSTTFAWSILNNEKVTLSFRPTTQGDEQALSSMVNEGDINQPIESIPSYLIDVIPELKVNGVLMLAGKSMTLGEDLVFNTKIIFPGKSKPTDYNYKVVAGSYLSVNVVAGSVSPDKLNKLQASLVSTKNKLESNDETQILSITRQKLLGDMFYTGTLGYFSELIVLAEIIASGSGAQYYLASGYGTFGYVPKVDYIFGFPVAIHEGGIVLDIPMNIVAATNNGNVSTKIEFVVQNGVLSSALEYTIPEQLFNIDPGNILSAISAVKALQVAMSENQKIYQITRINYSNVLPLLNLSTSILKEIEASVTSGKVVITHTDNISIPGFNGAGYIIFDPETGDGSYKLSGGFNGGMMVITTFLMLAAILFFSVKYWKCVRNYISR